MSYVNLILYSRATPLHDDVEEEWDDSLDANNPDNFNDKKEIYVK